MNLAILVLHWERSNLTYQCLQSILLSVQGNNQNVRIFVIDNGSRAPFKIPDSLTDGNITIIRNEENYGYGKGMNEGIRYVKEHWPEAEYLWLLNNDIQLSSEALPKMLSFLQREGGRTIVGAVLTDDSEFAKLQEVGGGQVIPFIGKIVINKSKTSQRLDFISGASICFSINTLDEIGLFDERFFMYWEDIDLCLRAKQKGIRLTIADNVYVHHLQNASLGRENPRGDYLQALSYVLFYEKHQRFWWLTVLLGGIGKLGLRLGKGQFRQIASTAKGLVDGIRKINAGYNAST
ncbi:MAG: glycosyltransferase family 2 protein [Bacteroidota bacterium]